MIVQWLRRRLEVVVACILVFAFSSFFILNKLIQSVLNHDIKPTVQYAQIALDTNRNAFNSLAVATRVHFQQNSEINDIILSSLKNKMKSLCGHVSKYCNLLTVAIDSAHETEIKEAFKTVIHRYNSSDFHIEYVSVSPWIGFTTALNAIIRYISTHHKHIQYLSFQSLEITQVSPSIVDILMNQYMDEDTLVCGPLLIDKQTTNMVNNWREMSVSGVNIPWNTLNIWNLNKLKLFGFSLISDGIIADIKGGIEEVLTISLIQHINGKDTNHCKLIIFPNKHNLIKWATDYGRTDAKRQKYHETKLNSKIQRAQHQLAQFKHLPHGTCQHIVHKF